MKKYPSLLFGLFLITGTAWALDGDAQRGQRAAAICVACHQADGSGMHIPGGESWPRLAGLDAGYIYHQLVDFKEGRRTNASMNPFSNLLNDQQMRDVSVYYSQLPATAGQGSEGVDDELMAHGRKLVQEGDWDRYILPCDSCHGPNNQGAGQHFPGIAGQHAGYIERQLLDWKEGRRDNDPLHLMLAIAERMNERDIQAVAAWLSAQPAR